MSTFQSGELRSQAAEELSLGTAREATSPQTNNDFWFKRFFGKPWWDIALSMILFCVLLLLTLLLYRFLAGWLSQKMTWEGFEKFATSPFATAVGAIGAASIAGTAVVLTLRQNKHVEASKTWWETFEWAAERAIPLKAENKALPYGTALDILSPLMDDDFGGRRFGRRARKSWALRKQACGSIVKLLNEPFREPESGTTDPATAAPATTVPTEPAAADHQGSSRSIQGARDLESIQNFIIAHPSSQAAAELSGTHYDALLMSHLASLLAEEEGLRIYANATDIRDHLPALAQYEDLNREADALLVKGEQAVVLEMKRINTVNVHSRIALEREAIRAKKLWSIAKIPTVLVTNRPISDSQVDRFRLEFSAPHFQVAQWTGKVQELRTLAGIVLDLLKPKQ